MNNLTKIGWARNSAKTKITELLKKKKIAYTWRKNGDCYSLYVDHTDLRKTNNIWTKVALGEK